MLCVVLFCKYEAFVCSELVEPRVQWVAWVCVMLCFVLSVVC